MERDITTLAEEQHGVLTHAQALAAGLTEDAIKHRRLRGRWEVVSDGVYRIPGSRPCWEQRLIALTLGAGPVAAASHRSAAALLGIPGFPRGGRVEVTTPRPRRHRAADARVHRWRVLPDHHLTVVEGIVSTRVPRTLVDLAGVLHPGRTERAVDNCLAMGIVTVESLRATFTDLAVRGRKGIAVMRHILAERADAYTPPASELEARFLALVRSADLPEPVRQLNVGDRQEWIGRVDFAYPEAGVLIELDSRRHHSAKLDMEADQARDERLAAAGWRHVVRVTWTDVVTDGGHVVSRLWLLLRPTAA